MRQDCRTGGAVRPLRRGCIDRDGLACGRLFLCARCRAQVLICSHCDRGQRYCADGCAWEARRRSQREAGRRYQRSRDGRFACAERNRRYRARRKIVTHQGSPRDGGDGVVVMTPAAALDRLLTTGSAGRPATHQPFWQCRWCGRICSHSVRLEPLRGRRVYRNHRRGPEHDHSP